MRGVPAERLWRVQFLFGHGEVRRAGQGEADVQHETVSAADAAGDGRLCSLRTRRLEPDAGDAAPEGTAAVRERQQSDGVFGEFADDISFYSSFCTIRTRDSF